MKRTLLSALLLPLAKCLLAQPASAQPSPPPPDTTGFGELRALDRMLTHPLSPDLIRPRNYAAILYKEQVKLSGLAVQQGKTLGTNASIDDKGGTLNLGTPAARLAWLGNARVALQATLKGTAEDGFVKLFSDEKYQKTLSYGGTIIGFGNGFSSYRERVKKNLHYQLRKLRQQDIEKWHDSLNPDSARHWRKIYAPVIAVFVLRWSIWQKWLQHDNRADKFYEQNGELGADRDDPNGRMLYLAYLDAEQQALPILDPNWDEWHQADEAAFVRKLNADTALVTTYVRQLDVLASPEKLKAEMSAKEPQTAAALVAKADQLGEKSEYGDILNSSRIIANGKERLARLKLYDSLEQHVAWVGKLRAWGSFTVLHSVVKQPIFAAANKSSTYADVLTDEYWQQQVALNILREGDYVNVTASAGVGLNNMLVFNKKDLTTYQTSSWQHTDADSVLVVTQKQLYRTSPSRVRYLSWQLQAALTFNKLFQGAGLTATASGLGSREDNAPGQHTYTLGVFVPVQAQKTTLLVIPQVRWKSTDEPNPWTFGFSITASIPGFVK